MNKSDFWFDLPGELIAQTPIEKREHSRLLRLDRQTGDMQHRRFYDLPGLLRRGDCLVLNDSRVMPARLIGSKETGGTVEVVLLRDTGDSLWECMVRPGKKLKVGTRLVFGDGEITATVTEAVEGGNRLVRFGCDGVFRDALERLGKMPLPPYIRCELVDAERYQTVYSRVSGSAAAPTAGLHFTDELLGKLGSIGVKLCCITLHVGLGTFRPVKTDTVEEHKMHAEYFIMTDETAETINRAKAEGGRIIAVGTTSCRAIETCAAKPRSGFTDIFIYPGYEFKVVDGLITNFHLPESTLIMLVCALAGRENVLRAYNEAISECYRFYSFGDAMLIL